MDDWSQHHIERRSTRTGSEGARESARDPRGELFPGFLFWIPSHRRENFHFLIFKCILGSDTPSGAFGHRHMKPAFLPVLRCPATVRADAPLGRRGNPSHKTRVAGALSWREPFISLMHVTWVINNTRDCYTTTSLAGTRALQRGKSRSRRKKTWINSNLLVQHALTRLILITIMLPLLGGGGD